MSDNASRAVDTGTECVTAHISARVGVITLNRPHRRNALHHDIFEAVPRLLDRFASDEDVGCVLLTGAGSAFCAGGDVRDGFGSASNAEVDVHGQAAALTRNARMVSLLHQMPTVTIAALPGAAVGAGMSIALSTDLRIAARSARLIPGWGKLALSGDFGSAWFLSRLVGPSKALELLLGGDAIDTDAALSLGLVNRVVSDDRLASDALTWAAQVAAGPVSAWASVKANLADAQSLSLDEAMPRESERMIRCARTAEHRQAVRAWLEASAAKAPSRADK